MNTARPNHIVREGIETGKVDELKGYERIRPEVKYGENSRIDLLLETENEPACFVEIKNVTLLADTGVAAFPDSVSKRATKHMNELKTMVQEGHRSVVFFLVSRTDVETMRPADHIDPAYGDSLRAAVHAGVEALAYRLVFSDESVTLGERLPIPDTPSLV